MQRYIGTPSNGSSVIYNIFHINYRGGTNMPLSAMRSRGFRHKARARVPGTTGFILREWFIIFLLIALSFIFLLG